MPPADHLIKRFVVAARGLSAFQCKFGVTGKPGGGSTTGGSAVRGVSHAFWIWIRVVKTSSMGRCFCHLRPILQVVMDTKYKRRYRKLGDRRLC
jgi:hypothetical protein